MSVLSDRTLRRLGPTLIDPFDVSRVQPASIDLTLGTSFARYVGRGDPEYPIYTDDRRDKSPQPVMKDCDVWWLHAGRFVLGTTAERVTCPVDMVGRIEGKSSLGRMGLSIHSTAGYVDPGFEGQVTLEFTNDNQHAIQLLPGMAICQVSFEYLDEPAELPYGSRGLGSKYQNQRGATGSRYAG